MFRKVLLYIRERLAEPGTHRSLAVILFAITGAGNSQALWEAVIYLIIMALGAYSAATPERKPEPPLSDPNAKRCRCQ